MAGGLARVFALDRRRVRERAVARFGVDRMVAEYEAVYRRLVVGPKAARAVQAEAGLHEGKANRGGR